MHTVDRSKTWCSDGCGSVGEFERSSDWGSKKGETGGGLDKAVWMNGEKFAKVSELGLL